MSEYRIDRWGFLRRDGKSVGWRLYGLFWAHGWLWTSWRVLERGDERVDEMRLNVSSTGDVSLCARL